MRQHVRLANGVTSLSLSAGFAALLLARTHLLACALLVLLAALLDVVDGAIARRAGGDHTFGAQLDSLTDLLCFCVVPAFALDAVAVETVPVPGAVVSGAFVVAGAWRLARFPLVQQQGSFVGLPTPAAGGLVVLLALTAPAALALAGAVLLAVLMVSSVQVPSVLAAAAVVRPGRRDGRGLAARGRSPLAARVLRQARRRPRDRRPGRRRERTGRVLRALRQAGARRRGRR